MNLRKPKNLRCHFERDVAQLPLKRVIPTFVELHSLLIALALLLLFTIADGALAESIASKQALGERLFFDKRLSFNQTKSCASCHNPRFAYTDGYRRSVTATGARTKVNAPSLLNVGDLRFFGMREPPSAVLSDSVARPLKASDPLELGTISHIDEILSRLNQDKVYQEAFDSLYPTSPAGITVGRIVLSLEAYLLTLRSDDSQYDRFVRGDVHALHPRAQRGLKIFLSAEGGCSSCHPPPSFTLATIPHTPQELVYLRWPTSSAPIRIPSLRNVQLTRPYLHDGSADTVIEAMLRHPSRTKDLTPIELRDLASFLFSLTEISLLKPIS